MFSSDFRFRIWFDVVSYAFDNLPVDNNILSFLVCWHCENWRSSLVEGEAEEMQSKLPVEFLVRVMRRYGSGERVPMAARETFLEREVIAID